MSGNESNQTGQVPTGGYGERGWDPLVASHEDIARFIQTGYEGASQLYDAGTFYAKSGDEKVYAKMLQTQAGVDVTKIYGDFNNWLDAQKKSEVDHAAYLAAKEASPGRDSTIVGFNQEKKGTVIGSTLPYSKAAF